MARNVFLEEAKDPGVTLANFNLDDLKQFKREGYFMPGDSSDYRQFGVGRDNVHGVLKYLMARVSRSAKFSMFGYDDDELDAIIQHLVKDDGVFFQGTLDKSQAGGVHEKKILATWDEKMRASFAIVTSATGQIQHTKGGVLDGIVAFEGSTNWSASGEGTGIGMGGAANVSGFKAQANTLTVHINPIEVQAFATYLDEQHAGGLARMARLHPEAVRAALAAPDPHT